jgi:hypothetical protein
MNNETHKASHDTIFVKMVLSAWQTQNTRVNELLAALTDEQLLAETAPGRNTGIYLLGHFAAINDRLFTLLDLGVRLHPELDEIFIDNPDKSGKTMPAIDELKKYWMEINSKLTKYFNSMQPAEWFIKHTAVSEEDFIQEPQRNKLNVLITRAVHQAYHLGQMAYLKNNRLA